MKEKTNRLKERDRGGREGGKVKAGEEKEEAITVF
jgi:hypothetical protein